MTLLETPARPSYGAPTVSVIVPAYNAGRTIDAALKSVFAQTFRDFEIIVMDDGSTDDTADHVAGWGGAVVYRTQPNAGPARARNEAIRLARGRLLAFLDADDVWLPTKLEHQVNYFETYPSTGLLHTDAYVSPVPAALLLEAGEPATITMPPPASAFCSIFHCDEAVRTITVMTPRDVVADVGWFDERREIHVEDWDLWLRIAARHPVGFIPAPLAIHRPGGGMSSKVEKTFRGQSVVIDKVKPLCAVACERHREDPVTCLEARQHLLHSQLGYERFWRGQQRPAREAYHRALATQPSDARARGYVVASYVGHWCLRPLQKAWRFMRANPSDAAAPPRMVAAPPSLLQDTAFRRVRAAAVARLHTADEAIFRRPDEVRRVVFEAASPLSMAVFKPIYERLRRDPRIQLWFTSNDRSWALSSIFQAAGVDHRVVSPAEVRWRKFDAYINTDFWNMTWLPRRTRRVHLFHGVAGKYGLDAPISIAPVVAAFDRLMFANTDRLNRYVEAGLVDPDSPQAALIGYPKVDCLVDGSFDRRQILASLGLDDARPTVMYAPTWSPYSSLHTAGERILTALATLDVNVIVKLHDRSLDTSLRGAGGVNWRERLHTLIKNNRIHLAEGADASPYLYVADVLVTDHSSVGFEYMLLDRPIVVVDCPDLFRHSGVNPQKVSLLRSAARVIDHGSCAAHAVARALVYPTEHGAERRAIASELFYRPGGATARAIQCLYDVLRLPAMAPAAVPSAPAVSMTPVEVRARQT